MMENILQKTQAKEPETDFKAYFICKRVSLTLSTYDIRFSDLTVYSKRSTMIESYQQQTNYLTLNVIDPFFFSFLVSFFFTYQHINIFIDIHML